ncbi:MAG: hypothetical protein JO022_12090, partial [Acidobacteriaceae bacterium]|nr:hypothetical protein [Acidobacteriaceae bacterium]
PVVATLYIVAFYVPATIGDYEADLASGNSTVAVRFGRDGAYRIGLVAVAVVSAIYVILAATNYIIPRDLLPAEITAGLITLAAYHRLLYKTYDPKEIVRGLAVIGVIAVVAVAAFGAMYVGWL